MEKLQQQALELKGVDTGEEGDQLQQRQKVNTMRQVSIVTTTLHIRKDLLLNG